jgi:hypothetical protein
VVEVAVAAALLLLVVVGLPMAYAVARDVVVAVVLAPLVGGLQCTAAAIAMVVVGGPLPLWLLVVTVAAWLVAVALIRRPRAPLPSLGPVDLVVMYGPLLLPALLVRRPPVAWDARSIWWFHAAWVDGGGAAFRDALGNPAFVFSHPDYPPFAPATVAGAWAVTPGSGLWVAQAVTTVLTLSAVAVLAYAVRHLVPTVSPWIARLAALAVGLGLWSVAEYGIAGGYVDHLCAAALAAAVVLLFVGGSVVAPGRRTPEPDASVASGSLALAVVLLSVAALTKNEGLVGVGIVALLFTVRARAELRRAAWVWVPVAVGVLWSVVARVFGAASDLSSSPRIGQLRSGDLTPLERVGPTLSKLGGQVGWVVAGAAVVSLVGAVTLGRRRRSLGLVGIGWPWLVMAIYTAALVGTYVISPYDLQWHLLTSVDRVGVLLVLVALATTASWVLVATAPEPDGSSNPREGDDDRSHPDDAPSRSPVDAAR